MKSLIVFYSLEGHTKFISNIIAEELDCDLLQLKPEKEIPETGIGRFFGVVRVQYLTKNQV